MVAFRVDANDNIALGHLYRCISIANALKKIGIAVIFILSDNNCEAILKEKQIEFLCLNNDYTDKDGEIYAIKKIVMDYDIKVLFVDSYQVTDKYFFAIGKIVNIAYIDDLLSIKQFVKLRIRPKYGCTIDEFENCNIDTKNSKLLLGSRYVPLRQEFSRKNISVRKTISNVFITTGGTDNLNFINTLLKKSEVLADRNITKHIVLGKYYKNMEELNDYKKNDSSIIVRQNISNVAEIMSMCDIGISAGGTTLAELCACGVATLCFSIADNQINGTKAYDAAGIMINCGDFRYDGASVIDNIENGLNKLVGDYELRKKMVNKAAIEIDGKGAMRIADEIAQIYIGG